MSDLLPPEPAPTRSRARRLLAPVIGLVLAAIAAGVLFGVSLPYVVLAPGSATPVGGLIEVPPEHRHPPRGEILFTTVALGETKVVDAIAAWLDPDVELVDREVFYPPEIDRQEFRELNLELMQSSERKAVVVALRHLGYDVVERGTGALVVRVLEGSAADGHLQPGDVVTAVDGQPITIASELQDAVRAHEPGDVVRFEVRSPEGLTRTEEIALGDREGQPFLGIELVTNDQEFSMPFDVDIDTGRVGGPSAGLAFTLAVLDSLTEGELTGGRKVAVTGTIEVDGTVGDVGGVAQKTAAVRDAGADVFLVPAGEYEIAKERAGDDLEVIPVRTLDDAIAALGNLGGNVQALATARGDTQ